MVPTCMRRSRSVALTVLNDTVSLESDEVVVACMKSDSSVEEAKVLTKSDRESSDEPKH